MVCVWVCDVCVMCVWVCVCEVLNVVAEPCVGVRKTQRARLPRKAFAQIHLHIPQFFIQQPPTLQLFNWEEFS